MQKVVSFSGGRTSAYLCKLMIDTYGRENVEFVYMDTGAEHLKTYDFIRNVDREFGLNLVCLRTKFNMELGKANGYHIVSIDDIGPDLKPWKDMIEKYGTPYNPGGAFCTDRMKLVPYKKYLDEKYGRKNYVTWLGIRADEPKRLKPKDNYDFMASISDFDKEDVLDWWSEQVFDLEIPEHFGNCVFCIKKGANKIALAQKDEPELAAEFKSMLESPNVRIVEGRKAGPLDMYRGKQSFGQIIKTFKDIDSEDIRSSLKNSKRFEVNSCSESCEVFSGDDNE
jgi:hypothetical protein